MSGYGPPRGWRGSNAWGAAPSQRPTEDAVSGDHVERLRAWRTFASQNRPGYDHMRDVSYDKAPVCDADLDAALDELERLRAERSATAALADELQDAELCDKVARSEWLHDCISRHETLGPAGRLADERLNETQARLCAAQDAWTAAAPQYRTARADAAPQQPKKSAVSQLPTCGYPACDDPDHQRKQQPERGSDADGAR